VLCRRSLLQAGITGLAVITLDACTQKSTPSAAKPPASSTTSGDPLPSYGPRLPLGPAIPSQPHQAATSAASVDKPRTTSQARSSTPENAPPPQTTVATQPTAQTSTRVITQAPPSNAIAWAKDVPVGQSRLVQTQSGYVLVTRTGTSSIVGFSAVCTHAGCTVAGTFQCPCHGSMFNPRTGAVVQGPAMSPLPSIGVAISGPYIVTT